jgi:hypothetical protein
MSKKESSITVESEVELEKWLDKSKTKLLLFDVHLNWTGRCETLIPQLNALYRSIDQSEERLIFLSLEVPKLATKFQSMVELSPSCTHSSSLNDSQNLSGDNSSGDSGSSNSRSHDDDFDDEDDTISMNSLMEKKSCSPLFLAIKDGKVVATVQGANFPAISKVVHEHIPSITEDD